MAWISVKDRLPSGTLERAQSVLITDGKNISIGWHEYNPEEINEKGRFFPEEYLWHDDANNLPADTWGWPEVTHWMPLPEVPIKDDEKNLSNTGYFPPPWEINEGTKQKTEGWLAFQDAMRKEPDCYRFDKEDES